MTAFRRKCMVVVGWADVKASPKQKIASNVDAAKA